MPTRLPTDCQLLVDPPGEGAWNMAVDEALLGETASSGVPTLRFYQWQRPTLSLGYFQKCAERACHPASSEADIVRRQSGGGAIVHDRELTYSLFLPESHWLSGSTQELYNRIHQAIIDVFQLHLPPDSHWQLALCDPSSKLSAADEPFLCFQRRAQGDILLQRHDDEMGVIAHKIVGSAQRRWHGAVLQHGSLLLEQSSAAPELPGIANLAEKSVTVEMLLAALPEHIAEAAELRLQSASLVSHVVDVATELCEIKYTSGEWTRAR